MRPRPRRAGAAGPGEGQRHALRGCVPADEASACQAHHRVGHRRGTDRTGHACGGDELRHVRAGAGAGVLSPPPSPHHRRRWRHRRRVAPEAGGAGRPSDHRRQAEGAWRHPAGAARCGARSSRPRFGRLLASTVRQPQEPRGLREAPSPLRAGRAAGHRRADRACRLGGGRCAG